MIGEQVIDSGQVFTCVLARPYITQAGDHIQLLTWEVGCAVCDAPVRFVRSERSFQIDRRRCDKHKSPKVRAARRSAA